MKNLTKNIQIPFARALYFIWRVSVKITKRSKVQTVKSSPARKHWKRRRLRLTHLVTNHDLSLLYFLKRTLSLSLKIPKPKQRNQRNCFFGFWIWNSMWSRKNNLSPSFKMEIASIPISSCSKEHQQIYQEWFHYADSGTYIFFFLDSLLRSVNVEAVRFIFGFR